ncbi:hypothetical protein OF829_14990 [Sphingomonas sp. LB-2]|uniref:hypothetical protein n=1 Tax=Sphingomonas caeni TaxID=2984949 RepID=UPI0022311534|nr:hypothetical protein [Sphingomonas caeni]MCW3848539.1 hypothetical protein [Sphingomonas caeni]
MIFAAAFALVVIPLPPQEAWEKIGESQGGAAIEIAPVRTEGGLRYVRVRVSLAPRAVIASITVNCAAKTAEFTGGVEIYADGKLSQTHPYPGGLTGFRPVADDPLSGPVAAHICPE